MRQESAASTKDRVAHYQLAPREGTRLREVYDAFMASKGLPIDRPVAAFTRSRLLMDLRDYYGLDIRSVPGSRKGHKGPGSKPAKYVLAGEWFGPTYVDYIAERITRYDREASQ